MIRQGDAVQVLAPAGSVIEGVPCITAPGLAPQYAQTLPRDLPVEIPIPSVLANLWEIAFTNQSQFDIVINWAYDWLPFYLTRFFRTPVAHIVSMGSLTNALDLTVKETLKAFPGSVAVHSMAQAATFKFAQASLEAGENPFFILPCGIDLNHYTYVPEVREAPICWIGRISPEKGLEDCAAIAQRCGIPVLVLGRMQDVDYWSQIQLKYPDAPLYYRGFFPTHEMQAILGKSRALLMTPKWIEAFGVVVVEALACGVPVVTYRRGGPAEIVEQGKTGWIVDPDNIDQAVDALNKVSDIKRQACRQRAESHYSLPVMAQVFKRWTDQVMNQHRA
jgi:UDP-glucose:tetrahydrobiopterin glucosyltransferase